MTASSDTVEAPARPMTRCASAIRAGRSSKNSATSTGNFIRAQAAATRALSSPRACWVRRIHWRSSAAEQRQRRGHDVGHHPRALRTAGHQQPDAAAGEIGIGRRRRRDDGGANRIAGEARLGPRRGVDSLQVGKAAGDERNAGTQETIGPAHHRVLLMQGARNAQQRGGDQRRRRRISAEAHHRARPRAPEQDQRRRHAEGQGERRARFGECSGGGRGGGGNEMDGAGGKIPAELHRPVVGRQFDLDAAAGERRGKGRGRKEMAAGAAGRQQDAARPAHSPATA